jgi:hypothetical protein
MVTRLVSFPGASNNWVSFGTPLDVDLTTIDDDSIMSRLFVVGHSVASASIVWRRSGYHIHSGVMGMAWGRESRPVPLVVSSYADSSNQSTHIRDDSNRANSPFLNATELLDIDLVAGTLYATNNISDPHLYTFEPRRLGLLPYLKQGRTNYGDWTAAGGAVSSSWLHTENGVYLMWGGPPPSGSLTGSMVVELSDSLASQGAGFSLSSINDPATDPETPVITLVQNDKDATRFRKTYSYYRQEPRLISVAKMGSNPSK